MDKNIIGYIIHEATTKSPFELIKKNDKYVMIRVVLQDFKMNRNLRLYESDVIIDGLKDSRVIELVSKKSWYGESGHPLEQTLERQTNIVKTNSSHIILSYDIYDDRIEGTVINSPYGPGQGFKDEIVDIGSETAFSMRGIGNVIKEQGFVRVTKPLKIITYDNVLYPSHKTAYQQAIVKENTSLTESGILIPIYNDMMNKVINESSNVNGIASMYGIDIRDLQITLTENYSAADIKLDNNTRIRVMLEETITKDNKYRKFLKELTRK